MAKFFLVQVTNPYFECGTILKFDNEILTDIDTKKSDFSTDYSIMDDYIEVSELKMNYLMKRDLKKRLGIHNSQLFERIEQLKAKDECYVIDGKYRERCTIIEKYFNNNQFLVKTKDKKEKTISILNIDLIVNIEYFICMDKCGGIEAGMLIIEEDNSRKTYPDGYFVCSFIDKLLKISRDEANFLCKYSYEERLRIHDDKLWESINQLNIGDRCCLVTKLDHPSYQIINKDVRDNTVEYIVQSVVGYMVCVDQTEIRPWQSPDRREDAAGRLMKFRRSIDQMKESWSLSTSFDTVQNSDEEKSVIEKTKYYESTVIDPRSVITIEQMDSDEWVKYMKVEFRLGQSYRKYSGTLLWIGVINKLMSSVIEVDLIMSNDPLYQYTCSKEVIDLIHLSGINNHVIVLLATVTKSKTLDESLYVKRIFKFIEKKELNVDILMDIIDSEDIRALEFIVKRWKYPIILEQYPDLLPSLIRQDHYDVIESLLDHFVASDNDSIDLLTVAKYFLLTEHYQTFIRAAKTSTNPNIILGNGETFLTDILKECDDEEVINRVIGSNIFDVNKPNVEGDSPLVLACRKLMVSTVRLLIGNGAVASYQNNMAIDTVTDLRNNYDDAIHLQKALEIMAIFTKEIRLDYNICSICMDRRIDTALNCGHTMCEMCAIKFTNCPDCNRDIVESRRIFLP